MTTKEHLGREKEGGKDVRSCDGAGDGHVAGVPNGVAQAGPREQPEEPHPDG